METLAERLVEADKRGDVAEKGFDDHKIYVEMSRNAYMKWDEIKKSNHPILDSSDVFCVQGD